MRRSTGFNDKTSPSIALWDDERSHHADQRLGIWDMWKSFNSSPVGEAGVHFQMLISFPVKPGVQGERAKGKREHFPPYENVGSIQSNSISEIFTYFVSFK